MRAIFFAIAVATVVPASMAQPAPIESAYTTLDLDRCDLLVDEPTFAKWRCSGFANIPLFVQNGDDRYDIDAGREDNDEHWANTFDYPGRKIEWRLSGGKPFAIIFRLDGANPDAPRTSRLIVKTIGQTSHGCRIADIDARKKNANEKARRAADQILSGFPRCLKP